MRRADPVGKIIGMPAAPRRERDDGGNILRIFAGQRQRTPGTGRMADHDHGLGADEGLLAQEAGRGGDLIRGDAARPGVIGLVAAALILQIFPPVAPWPGRSGTSTAKPRATSQAASARYSGCGICARRNTFWVEACAITASGNGPSRPA